MRIRSVETLHADTGWRTTSFVKIGTDSGLTGWSEFFESGWSPGLTPVIAALAPVVIGQDPRAFAKVSSDLQVATRMVPGGLAHQAMGAIENACIDLAGKAAGIPAYRLFGGPMRTEIPLYWSHCGVFRAAIPAVFETLVGTPPLRRVEDFEALGREVRARGYRSAKTNPLVFGSDGVRTSNPGFSPGPTLDYSGGGADLSIPALIEQLAALRAGTGPDIGIKLDLNFSLRGEGLLRAARALDDLGLDWIEVDGPDPDALAELRGRLRTPVASYESLYGLAQYRPFLERRAADFALIDVMWNGMRESVRIAALAEAHSTSVAVHNCYGHLANRIGAHFAAAVPNCAVLEIEADDVPWHADLVTTPPRIKNGTLLLDDAPGWGCDVNEDAVRAHPPKPDPNRPWLR